MADLALPKTYTSAEFWEFVKRPENANCFFERRHGEIVEFMPSNPIASKIAMLIGHKILSFLENNNLGDYAHVTGEQGGYDISEEDTFAPDVGVILKSRLENFPETGFAPISPDMAIEVVSPSDRAETVHQKVQTYLRNGTRLVIVVFPKSREVGIHTPEGSRTLTAEDTLDGGDVLPGFTLKVKDIFPKRMHQCVSCLMLLCFWKIYGARFASWASWNGS